MFKAFCWKPAYGQLSAVEVSPQFKFWRGLHSRTKKAMEFIAKGFSALREVERVIDYCERNDTRLIPLLRVAKQNFEMALEADNTNTHARYWLSKVHLKYHFCPGANKVVGAALLVEAAEMGNPDAQYDLGCRLRAEIRFPDKPETLTCYLDTAVNNKQQKCSSNGIHDKVAGLQMNLTPKIRTVSGVLLLQIMLLAVNPYAQSEQQAFYYLEKAVDQLYPGALYLLGAVYLTGDCVNQDISSAIWCFHRASEKGHAASAIAYGSLLLAGLQIPESITKFNVTKASSNRKLRNDSVANESNLAEMAREQFEIAANAGSDLGLKWLNLLDEEEKKKGASSS